MNNLAQVNFTTEQKGRPPLKVWEELLDNVKYRLVIVYPMELNIKGTLILEKRSRFSSLGEEIWEPITLKMDGIPINLILEEFCKYVARNPDIFTKRP